MRNDNAFRQKDGMGRREFLRGSAAALMLASWEAAVAEGRSSSAVGKPLVAWRQGHFQVHFVYTGVGETVFLVYPDGTSLLIDCGDHPARKRGKYAVPVLPDASRHAGEWVARYVLKTNPRREKVDYMLLTHYHSDHGGGRHYHAGLSANGRYYLSGFGQAMEYLRFGKAVDRAYPTYDDPLPLSAAADCWTLSHLDGVYRELVRRGTKVEKFRLEKGGDQLRPLYGGAAGFTWRPLSANGRLLGPDGSVRDLYADFIARARPGGLNENAMSIGLKYAYGPFSLYTAGDFEDRVPQTDGTRREIEEAMAEIVGPCTVAKVNHHGNSSMCEKLVGALRSQVYVGCVWDWFHVDDGTMTRLADRSLYPGDRLLCPGVMTAARRTRDGSRPWMADVAEATYEGAHVVFDVPPGGETFTLSLVSAADETLTVRSEIEMRTRT